MQTIVEIEIYNNPIGTLLSWRTATSIVSGYTNVSRTQEQCSFKLVYVTKFLSISDTDHCGHGTFRRAAQRSQAAGALVLAITVKHHQDKGPANKHFALSQHVFLHSG